MKTRSTALVTFFAAAISLSASAQTLDQPLRTDHQISNTTSDQLILKDPMIAGLLSSSMPGLGHFYTGQNKKGILFLIATVGAFGSAVAFAEPANLHLTDYDKVAYGGNEDGLMTVDELQNWEGGKFQDDAFEDLSTSRKIGTITSAAAGIGLYIWSIVDAKRSSREHNLKVIQKRIDLGLTASQTQTGLALNLHF